MSDPSNGSNLSRSAVQTFTDPIQTTFFKRVGNPGHILNLLNYVPGSFFFLKDHDSRMIWASEAAVERIRPANGGNILGKNDYDLFSKHVADQFIRDDQTVLQTGKPIFGRLELWFSERRELEWWVTTKIPVFDHAGKAIGIFGFLTNQGGQDRVPRQDARVSQAIAYINSHIREPLGVAEVAVAIDVSERQLLRLFREAMGIGVQKFIMKIKIEAASQALLRPGASAVTVASDYGFCDQSAFTRQFRLHTGMTPSTFSRRYA